MMNLNSLLNSNDDDSNAKKQQQQQQRPSQPPSTPVQQPGGAPQGFRDYSGPVHASPRNPSHDYPPPGPHASTPGSGPGAPPYASPGPYGSRPIPPPLQPLNSNDLRSPGPGSVSTPHSGPSPYRHTPTSSVSAGTSGGYPFPPTQPPSASSPVQHHHQYPPQGQPPRQQQQRDSYPQSRPSGPPVGMTGPPGAPYMQGPPQQQQAQHPHQHPQQPPHPQQQQHGQHPQQQHSQHPQHPQHPQHLQHPQHAQHPQGQQHPLHPQHPHHPSQQHPQHPQHLQHPHQQQHQQHQQGHPLQSPVGPPGSAPPPAYPPHQRTGSAHSVPTPTSAQPPQLQQQQQQGSRYGSPYSQNSPVVTHRQDPLIAQQQQQGPPLPQQQSHSTPHRSPYQQHQPAPFDPTRHPSQPPTPLGPPLSTNPQQQRTTSSGQLQQHQRSQPASPLLQRLSTGQLPSSSVHPYPNQKAQASPRSASSSVPPTSANARDSTRQQSTSRQGSGSYGQPEPPTASVGPPAVPGAPVPSEAVPGPTGPPSGPASGPASGPPSTSTSHRRSLSRSDRAPSVSVSPKTRVSSLPGGAPAMARPSPMDIDSSTHNSGPPTKRKLDERDLHPDELDRKDARRPAPFEVLNGTPQKQQQQKQQQRTPDAKALSSRPSSMAAHSAQSTPSAPKTAAPAASTPKPKKKLRYKEPPPWAREFDRQTLNQPNFIVRKHGGHGHGTGAKVAVKEQTMSRHTSPEASRQASRASGAGALASDAEAATASAAAGDKVPPSAGNAAAAIATANEARLASLGPWEESVTGAKPYEELTRKVADFLYLNVVSNPNMMEIQQLDVQFEIEAKLGQLISKDTNQRIELPVSSECLLQDTGRVTFKSSMTDVQHKAFNEYLNRLVVDTDARNPANGGKPRVPIMYTHRREVDRFFELPLGMQDLLPACVRNLLPHRHPVKVRVSYDKKTNEMLAKIVKARVADLNIYFPDSSLDCRLSVNLEMPWSGSVEELEKMAAASTRERPADREKDRLSYRQSHYQIDLTQVTYKIQGPQKMEREEKEHELEIEMAANMLIQQGRLAANGAPHAYQELVDGLVDNVRILARRSGV